MNGSKIIGDGEASGVQNESQATSMPTITGDGMY